MVNGWMTVKWLFQFSITHDGNNIEAYISYIELGIPERKNIQISWCQRFSNLSKVKVENPRGIVSSGITKFAQFLACNVIYIYGALKYPFNWHFNKKQDTILLSHILFSKNNTRMLSQSLGFELRNLTLINYLYLRNIEEAYRPAANYRYVFFKASI